MVLGSVHPRITVRQRGSGPLTAAAQHLMPDLCFPLAPRMQGPSSATTRRPRGPRPALPRPGLPSQVADFEQESGDEELAAALRHVTQLTRLECETTRIIPHLAPLTALGALTLHNASAADLSIQDLEQLRELPSLRCLCFGRGLPEGAARHRRLEVRAGVGSVAGWRQGLTEHAAQFASLLCWASRLRAALACSVRTIYLPLPRPPSPPAAAAALRAAGGLLCAPALRPPHPLQLAWQNVECNPNKRATAHVCEPLAALTHAL